MEGELEGDEARGRETRRKLCQEHRKETRVEPDGSCPAHLVLKSEI